jgi:hypothetical protein
MTDKSGTSSVYTSSPKSKPTYSAHRSSSCFDSHFDSMKGSIKPDNEKNELIACLIEELKETRARENNLKRINNALSKAFSSGG